MSKKDTGNSKNGSFSWYSYLVILLSLCGFALVIITYAIITNVIWKSVVPNTVKANLVVSHIESSIDGDKNGGCDQQPIDIYIEEHPELLKKEIVISSEDIDKICDNIQVYVTQYISFAAAIMALLITVLSVAVPIMNYVFVWKDQLGRASKELDELKEKAKQGANEIAEMVS